MHVPLVEQFWHELIFTALIAIVMGVAVWPYKKVKAAYAALLEGQKAVQVELSTQRTNCLATLQDQGEKQIEILGKVADTLNAMHLDQRELLGRIK